MIGPLILASMLGAVVLWLRHRASVKRNLSGTQAERPVFQVGPPSRRVSPLGRERL